jgi:gliding motility-associated-like protein
VNTKYILTTRTQDGCSTKDSIYINLSETSIITVPNAFVPGSNYNGSIKAIIKGTARLRYFRIFDRWGKLVFEGKDINIGWDGTVGGTPAPSGVYVYEAEAITERGRILHKQGNITLLK